MKMKYQGPNPKDINPEYPDHTYEQIVCLANGELKKILQNRYLQKYGYTRETYLEKFPDAPIKSYSAVDSYRNAALNDGGMRSNNMTKSNNSGPDSEFQKNRVAAQRKFLDSEDSVEYRKWLGEKAKKQHEDGELPDSVRRYFVEKYLGSDDQKNRQTRMSGENNLVHKLGVLDKIANTKLERYGSSTYNNVEKSIETRRNNHDGKSFYLDLTKRQYKNYEISYQSTYEYHFLEYCENKNIINSVKNAKTLKDDLYPGKYYIPDYILFDEYSVEVKSWYIQQRQDMITPDHIKNKKDLVERHGYKWLYLLDKNYEDLDVIIESKTA